MKDISYYDIELKTFELHCFVGSPRDVMAKVSAVQSAGAVEYIEYVFAEEYSPNPNKCPKQSDGMRSTTSLPLLPCFELLSVWKAWTPL